MTAAVKDELSRLVVTKPCCRKAEMSALLRFAGGLHLVSGRLVIEVELDAGATALALPDARADEVQPAGEAQQRGHLRLAAARLGDREPRQLVLDGSCHRHAVPPFPVSPVMIW